MLISLNVVTFHSVHIYQNVYLKTLTLVIVNCTSIKLEEKLNEINFQVEYYS